MGVGQEYWPSKFEWIETKQISKIRPFWWILCGPSGAPVNCQPRISLAESCLATRYPDDIWAVDWTAAEWLRKDLWRCGMNWNCLVKSGQKLVGIPQSCHFWAPSPIHNFGFGGSMSIPNLASFFGHILVDPKEPSKSQELVVGPGLGICLKDCHFCGHELLCWGQDPDQRLGRCEGNLRAVPQLGVAVPQQDPGIPWATGWAGLVGGWCTL